MGKRPILSNEGDIMSGCDAVCQPGVNVSIRPTISERLINEKKSLTLRLEEVDKAIELLEKNPDTLQVMDALSKVMHLGY